MQASSRDGGGGASSLASQSTTIALPRASIDDDDRSANARTDDSIWPRTRGLAGNDERYSSTPPSLSDEGDGGSRTLGWST